MAAPAWLHLIWQPPGGKRFDVICNNWENNDEKITFLCKTNTLQAVQYKNDDSLF